MAAPSNILPRKDYILKRYKLTLAGWQKLFREQGGACPICTRPFSVKVKPVVDHDHKTGKVRGLLCRFCNHKVVGQHRFPDKLRRAAEYLERALKD